MVPRLELFESFMVPFLCLFSIRGSRYLLYLFYVDEPHYLEVQMTLTTTHVSYNYLILDPIYYEHECHSMLSTLT